MNMMPSLSHDDVHILEYVSYHDKSGNRRQTKCQILSFFLRINFTWSSLPRIKLARFNASFHAAMHKSLLG